MLDPLYLLAAVGPAVAAPAAAGRAVAAAAAAAAAVSLVEVLAVAVAAAVAAGGGGPAAAAYEVVEVVHYQSHPLAPSDPQALPLEAFARKGGHLEPPCPQHSQAASAAYVGEDRADPAPGARPIGEGCQEGPAVEAVALP